MSIDDFSFKKTPEVEITNKENILIGEKPGYCKIS